MGDHPAGIINEGDQKRSPGAIRLLDSRAVHRIGLPQLIGESHGKRVPQLFLLILG